MNVALLLILLVAMAMLLAGAMNSRRSNPVVMVAAALLMTGCASIIGFTLGDVRVGYLEERADSVITLTADLLSQGRCDEVTEAYQGATSTPNPLNGTMRALRELDTAVQQSP